MKQTTLDQIADKLNDKIGFMHKDLVAELNAVLFPYLGARDQVAEQLDALIESPHHQPTDGQEGNREQRIRPA